MLYRWPLAVVCGVGSKSPPLIVPTLKYLVAFSFFCRQFPLTLIQSWLADGCAEAEAS